MLQLKRCTRVFKSFLLIFLAFHLGSATFNQEWICECDKNPERMTCCCNCPKCVDKRGGLLSYCHVQNRSKTGEGDKNPAFTSPTCVCGSGKAIFTLPNNIPFLAQSPPKLSSLFGTGTVIMMEGVPNLEDIVLSLDPPG